MMLAKHKITAYDFLLEEYKFTIYPNNEVKIISLDDDCVEVQVGKEVGYISYKQFKNGLTENINERKDNNR